MGENFLFVTRKELFYAAVMLHMRQLVNIVYEFPADNTKFDQELNEARSSLRKKKLLTESVRNGISLSFALIVCAAFCSNPDSCEVVDSNGYYATIYHAGGVHMLLERRSEDELAAVWYAHKEKLDQYLENKIKEAAEKEAESDGRA